MAKPIFVIRADHRFWEDEKMPVFMEDLNTHFNNEYNLLIIPNNDNPNKTEFECYNVPDIDEKTVKQFQDEIFDIVEKYTTDEQA